MAVKPRPHGYVPMTKTDWHTGVNHDAIDASRGVCGN